MIKIRSANEEDGKVVVALGNKVLAYHQSFDSFYQPVVVDAQIVSEPEKITFLASNDEDEVVGYIQGIFRADPADRSVPFAVIQSVWVEESVRGKGVAQQLVEKFEDDVKHKGAKQIDLLVDVRNDLALALWGKAGYEVYQEKRRKLI